MVDESGPAAMGFPSTREHLCPVCATARGLGHREDGALLPDFRAGSTFLSKNEAKLCGTTSPDKKIYIYTATVLKPLCVK